MKKLMKWSVILGVAACLLGVGMMTAGAMMDGMEELNRYLNQIDLDRARMVMDRADAAPASDAAPTSDAVPASDAAPASDAVPASDAAPASDETPVPNTASEGTGGIYDQSFDGIRKLDIESAAGQVVIAVEERDDPQDTRIFVSDESGMDPGTAGIFGSPYQISQDGDELKIENGWSAGFHRHPEQTHHEEPAAVYEGPLVIYVPAGYRFQEVDVELQSGSLEMDELYADKLSLEVAAGEIKANYVSVAELDTECVAGNVELVLEGTRTQYDYELDCRAGTIELLGDTEEVYSALNREKKIDNHTGRRVELDCTTGRISLEFADE